MAARARIMTPVFRASFPNVFKATAFDATTTPKYSVCAIWRPGDFTDREKKQWQSLLKALDEESKARFRKPFKQLPASFKKGLRNGEEKADMEGFGAGTVFANLTSMQKPGVVNREKEPLGPEEGNDDEIYPGCFCRATVSVYSYDNRGKGLALGLFNVQKVGDGDRLDGRTDAAEDFAGGGGDDGDDDFDSRFGEQVSGVAGAAGAEKDPLDGDDDFDDDTPF